TSLRRRSAATAATSRSRPTSDVSGTGSAPAEPAAGARSAAVAEYGYGDVAAPWYSRPDPFYCTQPAVSEARARAAVGDGRHAVAEGAGERMAFYLWCRQQGRWPQEVVGL